MKKLELRIIQMEYLEALSIEQRARDVTDATANKFFNAFVEFIGDIDKAELAEVSDAQRSNLMQRMNGIITRVLQRAVGEEDEEHEPEPNSEMPSLAEMLRGLGLSSQDEINPGKTDIIVEFIEPVDGFRSGQVLAAKVGKQSRALFGDILCSPDNSAEVILVPVENLTEESRARLLAECLRNLPNE